MTTTTVVSDVMVAGTTPLSAEEATQIPIDLFNRQSIIDQILDILHLVSENRSSYTFSLNGAWGTGKTFVLNRLMQQLLADQDGERYFVFYYNCWKYDYYEEPLVAIVASMLDSIDEETHLFPSSLRENARNWYAFARPILEKIAKEFCKNKIGFDITDILSPLKDGSDSCKVHIEEKEVSHGYDTYYAFKKTVRSAQMGIQSLSEQKTVVVIVDELDRCLPQYAIKVLERLHHLFSGISNSAVILGIDKDQLDQAVVGTFGRHTDTSKYMQKFIDFELSLNIGKITGNFTEKNADYFSMFDADGIETNFSVDLFASALFANIEIRTQEHLMARIKTVHRLLFPSGKKDYAFACFEMMWLVFTDVYGLTEMPISYDARYEKRCFFVQYGDLPAFSDYIQTQWMMPVTSSGEDSFTKIRYYNLSEPIDIPHLLVWYLNQMYPNPSVHYHLALSPHQNVELSNTLEDLKKFTSLIQIIK